MTLRTEKATYSWDLPHGYDEVSRAQQECACGRHETHSLHGAPVTEQAAHQMPLQTEKGSPVQTARTSSFDNSKGS